MQEGMTAIFGNGRLLVVRDVRMALILSVGARDEDSGL